MKGIYLCNMENIPYSNDVYGYIISYVFWNCTPKSSVWLCCLYVVLLHTFGG